MTSMTGPAITQAAISIPARFSDSERATAESAIANFSLAYQVSDAALSDPAAKDWLPELAKYWAGPPFENQKASIAGFINDGLHATGMRIVVGEVVEVTATIVSVQACVNSDAFDVFDESGASHMNRTNGSTQTISYRITDIPGAGWRIDDLTLPSNEPC